MKVEVAVLGSPSLTVLIVSGRKATLNQSVRSEMRSCVKVEVAILGSQSLIVLMVGVDGRKAALEEEAHLNAGIIWVVTV